MAHRLYRTPPDELHCNAIRRSAEGLCHNRPGYKTKHLGYGRCFLHGGNTPWGEEQGIRLMTEAKLNKAVVTYGLPVEIDPQAALIGEVHRTAGAVAYLGQRIRELRDDDLTWGMKESIIGGEGRVLQQRFSAETNGLLKLYRQERAHLVSVCKTAIDCGIAERQVKLAEEEGQLIARVIVGVLSDIGIEMTPEVRLSLRRQLLLAEGVDPSTDPSTLDVTYKDVTPSPHPASPDTSPPNTSD